VTVVGVVGGPVLRRGGKEEEINSTGWGAATGSPRKAAYLVHQAGANAEPLFWLYLRGEGKEGGSKRRVGRRTSGGWTTPAIESQGGGADRTLSRADVLWGGRGEKTGRQERGGNRGNLAGTIYPPAPPEWKLLQVGARATTPYPPVGILQSTLLQSEREVILNVQLSLRGTRRGCLQERFVSLLITFLPLITLLMTGGDRGPN